MKRQGHGFSRSAEWMVLALFSLLTGLFAALPISRAAVVEVWERRYNGPGNGQDQGHAVAMDAHGNVVVTGISIDAKGTFDFYTAKYARAGGALLWEHRYDGASGGDDQPWSMALDGDGNVIVTGFTSDPAGDPFSGMDFYTAKYAAADGCLLWEQRYDGPSSHYDQAQALAVDGGGNVIVTGVSYSGEGGNDFYTAKYAAADGALIWERRYDGPANGADGAQAVALDRDGNVIVTGWSEQEPGGPSDCYTAKYAGQDGRLIWSRSYNGRADGNDVSTAIALDRAGNAVVTISSSNGTNDDCVVIKYSAASGRKIWETRYDSAGGGLYDRPVAIALDSADNVFVTGTSGGAPVLGVPSLGFDFTIKLMASSGSLRWKTNSHLWEGRALAVDSKDNVVMAGYRTGLAIVKYAGTNGAVLWVESYDTPPPQISYSTSPRSLCLASNGVIAVTGGHATNYNVLMGPLRTADFLTILYQETLPAVSIQMVSAGTRLRFAGTPGVAYQIERASSISGPWSLMASPVASANGLVEHTDTNLPPTAAFYRSRLP